MRRERRRHGDLPGHRRRTSATDWRTCPGWLAADVPLTVGSDSHVTRSWVEELRWLEYGQRLGLQQRNVAARPGRQPSTAARLFDACARG